MISYENIKEAQDTLIKCWGDDGKKVIEECAKVKPFNGSMKSFFEYCACCGGNWVGMLLSGVKALLRHSVVFVPLWYFVESISRMNVE